VFKNDSSFGTNGSIILRFNYYSYNKSEYFKTTDFGYDYRGTDFENVLSVLLDIFLF